MKKNLLLSTHTNTIVNPVVWEMRKIAIDGNIVPHAFFSHVVWKTKGGKIHPQLLAINILAEIVYWYRPSEKIDEQSGHVSYSQKFRADKLQQSYAQLASKFGVTKRLVKEACDFLKDLGLIDVEFRDIKVNGQTLRNVMYIEPRLEQRMNILFSDESDKEVLRNSVTRTGPTKKRTSSNEKCGGRIAKKSETCTENTTQTISETTTTAAVVVDSEEGEEYRADIVKYYLPVEVLAAIDYVIARSPSIQPVKIRHATWVLYHSTKPVRMWPEAINATVNRGIWHPSGCPTPSQLACEKAATALIEAKYRRKRTEVEAKEQEIEAKFAALSDAERNKYRNQFRRRNIATHPEAIEAGALGEFAREVSNG